MGRHATTTLAAWRQMRSRRAARELAQELRRGMPRTIRAGGVIPRFDPAEQGPIQPSGHVSPPGPVEPHVTQNTHRAGSIAWAFFYAYWRPGA